MNIAGTDELDTLHQWAVLRDGAAQPRPAKNAPTIPSMPAASARTAPRKNAHSANRNRYERLAPKRTKNQRATRGSAKSDPSEEREADDHLGAPGR